MKKILPFLVLLLISNLVFSQTKNDQIAINNFKAYYNTNNYAEIFNSFSPQMQSSLPLEQTKQLLTGLKQQAGIIKSTSFIGKKDGYASYKATLENAVLAVNISLDKQNKINGLLLKPYKEPSKTNSKNGLDSYPKEIAKMIFEASRDLPSNAQLSIAIIEDGKTKYYGIIKENDIIKPIENQNKVFEIGSISKVFTSTVLASLVQKGKIKLTDNINTYYPSPFKNNIKISFEKLANHTAGLPRLPDNLNLLNSTNPYKDFGKKEMDEYLTTFLKTNSNKYDYSNTGAGLLGYTLGLSQKKSFQKLLEKNVFKKYKMNSSFTTSQGMGSELIKGMNDKGQSVSNWDFKAMFGAGGVLSTTEDLIKFAKAQFDPQNKELALTRKATFDINGDMKIGLGWHILKSKSGKKLIWHNGGTGGYTSSMAVNLQEKTAVIILSNVSNINDNIDRLCFELINR